MPALVVASLLALLLPAQEGPKTLPDGNWGGNHVGIEVDAKGVRFEFDCAHGTTDSIRVGKDGSFEVSGTSCGNGRAHPAGGRLRRARAVLGPHRGRHDDVDGETTSPAETIRTYTPSAAGSPSP
jgi:hypothetical protein